MIFYTLLLIEAWNCLKFGETGQGCQLWQPVTRVQPGLAAVASCDSWHCSVKELCPVQRADWVARTGINVSSNYSAVLDVVRSKATSGSVQMLLMSCIVIRSSLFLLNSLSEFKHGESERELRRNEIDCSVVVEFLHSTSVFYSPNLVKRVRGKRS